MIRPAKISEITDIITISKTCAQHMIDKGIYQWNDCYPSKEHFETDIERDELFVLELGHKVAGTIVISTLMDEEYKHVQWLTPNGNNIYIHRLSIHPENQGRGHAQVLMNFAEDFAKAKNFDSVRLDTFSQNMRNQKFYETRGYTRLGDIYFPKQSEHPFHCYELLL